MAEKNKTFSIVALVCGILFWIPVVGFVLAILGIIFGVLALNRIKSQPAKYDGRGMALAGLILGIVGLILLIVATIILGVLFANNITTLGNLIT
ncbi:MAG: DUF4190 domain-containing protein [archaeon]